jgi:hypothetical protein
MNTFIVKQVKKIGKNKIIKNVINEIISWFIRFSIEKEYRQHKCDNLHNKTNKNKKRCRCSKYKKKIHKLLHTTENEKKISQNKVIELVDEIKQLTDKNTKLETENQELKIKLKNKNFKSQQIFTLIPIYVSI